MRLCLSVNIDRYSGFQFYSAVVGPDCDLLEPALNEGFIKFGKICGLCFDKILQVGDAAYLLITLYSVNGSLLALFSKSKNLLGNFIVGFFNVSLFNKLLLKLHKLFIDTISGDCGRFSNDRSDILLPIIADNQYTALTIFFTLNDRELPISDADIFKSKIYNQLESDEKKLSLIDRRIWTNKLQKQMKVFNSCSIIIYFVFAL